MYLNFEYIKPGDIVVFNMPHRTVVRYNANLNLLTPAEMFDVEKGQVALVLTVPAINKFFNNEIIILHDGSNVLYTSTFHVKKL